MKLHDYDAIKKRLYWLLVHTNDKQLKTFYKNALKGVKGYQYDK